jgi:hypothetical protein
MFEFTDEEYGLIPGNVAVHVGKGTVLRVTNPSTLRVHAFAAPTFLASAVQRKLQDEDCEVESSTFGSPQIAAGSWVEEFLVPTAANTYGSYCEIGVKLNPDGSPQLNTGHAGRGMVGTITVSP